MDPFPRLVAVFVFTLFTLYPTLVSSVARMLNCSDPIGGKRYLVADLTVTCYVGWHLVYLGGACFYFVVYCIGIPTLVFTVAACKTPLVCRRRKRYDAATNPTTRGVKCGFASAFSSTATRRMAAQSSWAERRM